MQSDPSTASEFDEEWEADADRRLGAVDYDTQLGKDLGRDAQRLARGEISEAEFHERYHEQVLDEFGVDQRLETYTADTSPAVPGVDTSTDDEGPWDGGTGGGGGEDPSNLPGVPGEDPSRRSVLKTAGALGAAAVGIAGVEGMTTGVDGSSDEPDSQLGMAINMNSCIACLQCVEACNTENNNTPDALWMFVHRYEQDDYRDTEEYLPRPCQHCSDAPCEAACPTTARFQRDEDGIVLTDYDSCIGCRYCEVACPYGVNYLQWDEPHDPEEFTEMHEAEGGIELAPSDLAENVTIDEEENITAGDLNESITETIDDPRQTADGTHGGGNPPKGVMGKCTFCVHRQDSESEALQGTTACEQVFPVDAIHFGDLEDEESAPRQHIADLDDDESTYRLLEDRGTEPNVIYVGSEPSPDATPVEGPRTVEDMHRDLTRSRTGRGPVEFPDRGDEDDS